MNEFRTVLTTAIVALAFIPGLAEANSGDFTGGVAIGSGYAGGSTPTDGAIIQGEVGMNLSTPSTPLDLATDSSGYALRIRQNSGNTKNAFLQFTDYAVTKEIGGISVDNSGNVNLRSGVGGVTTMYLSSGNKVGIGTSSPAQALEVNGEVQVDTFGSARWHLAASSERPCCRSAIPRLLCAMAKSGLSATACLKQPTASSRLPCAFRMLPRLLCASAKFGS
jgi:hypothetical protein